MFICGFHDLANGDMEIGNMKTRTILAAALAVAAVLALAALAVCGGPSDGDGRGNGASAPPALNDPIVYGVRVNGKMLSSDNLVVQCGTGTATYDPATNELTLADATITKGTAAAGTAGSPCIFSDSTLTIRLEGFNTIEAPIDAGIQIGTTSGQADLEILGPGSMEIHVPSGVGIRVSGELYINGVSLDVISEQECIMAAQMLIEGEDSHILLNRGSSGGACAVISSRDAEIDEGIIRGNRAPLFDFASGGSWNVTNGGLVVGYDQSLAPFTPGSDTGISTIPATNAT
jgi:hypothetical protein